MASFTFDVEGWCKANGFNIGRELAALGVTDPEDLTNVSEEDLQSFGIDKPFVIKKFFSRANQEFDRFKELRGEKQKKEDARLTLYSDIEVLDKARENGSISGEDHVAMVQQLRKRFLRLFGNDGDTEDKTPVKIELAGEKTEMPMNKETTVKDVKVFIGEQKKQDPRNVRLLYRTEEMRVVGEGGKLNLVTDYTGPDFEGIDEMRAILPISEFAGQNEIEGADVDANKNAIGSKYDLGQAGGFIGMKVFVINCCQECQFQKAQEALTEMGFTIEYLPVFSKVSSVDGSFDANLHTASQVWIISSSVSGGNLPSACYEKLKDAYFKGKNLYLWGDNHPYFAEANIILNLVLPGKGVQLSGNDPGQKVQLARQVSSGPGFSSKHVIFTGIASLYEGVTIARISKGSSDLSMIMNGSSGYPVTAVLDRVHTSGRLAIDGGFTRLCHNWDNAGSSRFVKNIAAWLAAIDCDWKE